MYKIVELVCGLLSLAASQAGHDIRHTIVNDANLIETARGYAMNSPEFACNDWQTVSVNDGTLQAYSSSCQLTTMNQHQLMHSKSTQDLIHQTKHSLAAKGMNGTDGGHVSIGNSIFIGQQANSRRQRQGSVRYSMDGNSVVSSPSTNLGMLNFNSHGHSVTKYGDNDMTIAKPGLPDNINRVFVANDMVTFVYNDGRVLMKPSCCLDSDEQHLVRKLTPEVREVKQKIESEMENMRQKQQERQRKLQQKLQHDELKLHQDLKYMEYKLQQDKRNLAQKLAEDEQILNQDRENLKRAQQHHQYI